MLNIAGRITLVQSRLTNIPLFMMSFYPLHVGIRKKTDFYRAVWQEDENKKNHLVNWKTCFLPKQQGGLGILNLDLMNKALLAKWFWRLETENGLWQEVLINKYVKINAYLESNLKWEILTSGPAF